MPDNDADVFLKPFNRMTQQIEDIFWSAVDIENAQERQEYLHAQCRNHPDWLAELDPLVRAHFASGTFMSRPAPELFLAADTAQAANPSTSSEGDSDSELLPALPGKSIGPFKLLEEIGRGGMAVVFRAQQDHPIRRQVALKVIRPGMDSDQLRARFQIERQALAAMNHPGIARVFDAGVTEHGHPYYAMELVEGEPITTYCQTHKLALAERIALMQQACAAIAHAHQQGIIHRDIKPANLLVAEQDHSTIVKVIDFGIAKHLALGAAPVAITRSGQLIGTPQYMSPEQAAQNDLKTDTRTDVYSLGAVLYEILTDRPPIPAGSLLETLTRVAEDVPPKPSQFNRAIHSDLETVCLTCLQKEPSDRYASTRELAEDLHRVQTGYPVRARPVGAPRRVWMWANRSPLAAILILAMTLVSLILVASWAVLTWKLKTQHDEILSQQTELENEKKFALDNFHRAHLAIRQYLTSFRSHTPLGSSSNLAFQKEMIETGIDFYNDLLRHGNSEAGWRAASDDLVVARIEQAELYLEFGKVMLVSEDYPESIAAYRTAIRIFDDVIHSTSDPKHTASALQKKGVTLTSMVETYRRTGQLEQAETAARDGLVCYEQLVHRQELTEDYGNWYQAMSWQRLGRIQRDRDELAQAAVSFERARQFCVLLPTVHDFRLSLCEVLLAQSEILSCQHAPDAALQKAIEATRVIENVCASSIPTLARYENARISSFLRQAECWEQTNERSKAVAMLTSATELTQDLCERYPEVEQFSNRLLNLLDQKNQFAETPKERDDIQAKINAPRADQTGTQPPVEQWLANARAEAHLANNELGRMRIQNAIVHFESALTLVERLPADFKPYAVKPLRTGLHLQLAKAHFQIRAFDHSRTHLEQFRKMQGTLSSSLTCMLALCSVINGASLETLHEDALQILNQPQIDLSSANYYQSLIPLTKLISKTHTVDEADCSQEFQQFQKMVDSLDELNTPQALELAYALCLTVDFLVERGRGSRDREFISWAKLAAVRCLSSQDFEPKSKLARSFKTDVRLACLHDHPRFQELTQKLNEPP